MKSKSHLSVVKSGGDAAVFEATLEEREDGVKSPFVDDMGSSEGAHDSGVNNEDGDEDDVVRML